MDSLSLVYSILQELELPYTVQNFNDNHLVIVTCEPYKCLIIKPDSLQIKMVADVGYVTLPILGEITDDLYNSYLEFIKLCLFKDELFEHNDNASALFDAYLTDLGLKRASLRAGFGDRTALVGFNKSAICVIAEGLMVWFNPPTKDFKGNPSLCILEHLMGELDCSQFYNLSEALNE